MPRSSLFMLISNFLFAKLPLVYPLSSYWFLLQDIFTCISWVLIIFNKVINFLQLGDRINYYESYPESKTATGTSFWFAGNAIELPHFFPLHVSWTMTIQSRAECVRKFFRSKLIVKWKLYMVIESWRTNVVTSLKKVIRLQTLHLKNLKIRSVTIADWLWMHLAQYYRKAAFGWKKVVNQRSAKGRDALTLLTYFSTKKMYFVTKELRFLALKNRQICMCLLS